MMKYKASLWYILRYLLKDSFKKLYSKKDIKIILKNSKKEYRRLLLKADDIGSNNPMAVNVYFVLVFLSIYTGNRDLVSISDLEFLTKDIYNNALIKKFFKRMDLSKKSHFAYHLRFMKKSKRWIDKRRDLYPESWEIHIDEDNENNEIKFHFTSCPIAKFMADNGYAEITEIFCKMDYLNYKNMNAVLYRENTISSGGSICDYRIVPNGLL